MSPCGCKPTLLPLELGVLACCRFFYISVVHVHVVPKFVLKFCLNFFPFKGFAKLVSESRSDGPRVHWVLPPTMSASQLSNVFKLDWIHK